MHQLTLLSKQAGRCKHSTLQQPQASVQVNKAVLFGTYRSRRAHALSDSVWCYKGWEHWQAIRERESKRHDTHAL